MLRGGGKWNFYFLLSPPIEPNSFSCTPTQSHPCWFSCWRTLGRQSRGHSPAWRRIKTTCVQPSPSVKVASSHHIKVVGTATHAASSKSGNCLLSLLNRDLPPPSLSTLVPGPADALGASSLPKRKVQNSTYLNCRGKTEANKDILIHRPNRRIWGWPTILFWKDFANIFGRAECYLILVKFNAVLFL